MLRLSGGQVESLWDDVLPAEVRVLPEDLAALDELLSDPALLAPIAASWQSESLAHGRPTISMQTYVRLMVIKHRTGWGYETLMREVSDSLHLRRFCLIGLGERVPDESTVRKLTRRLGASVVNEITRVVIDKARREKRFRPRAARIDSTVVEADVRYPTDSGLAWDSARVLAREARKLLVKVGKDAGRIRDRSRAISRRVRAMTRTLGRRTGERKQQVLELTEQAGKLMQRSIREAKRLVVVARRRARGRGAQAKLRQIQKLEAIIERSERVAEQIRKRMRGEKITNRLISIFDPDARPIRKGKLGKPNEFGFVTQICEVTENTKTGARGLIVPTRRRRARQPDRGHTAARHGRGAPATRDPTAGGRARRRLQRRAERRGAGAVRSRADVHRGPPTARLAANPATPGPLPDRQRRSDQPPQTRVRAAPQQAQGPPGNASLDRMVDPHLQP